MMECRVFQQKSPAQEMVSLHLPLGSPQKTIVNRRYVQWLAFNSILLRMQPCATISPKDALDLEAPMGRLFMIKNINTHLSVFPFKVKSKNMFFHTGQR